MLGSEYIFAIVKGWRHPYWICGAAEHLSKWLSRSKRIKPPMVKGEGICRIDRFTAERDLSLFKYTSVDCEGEITEGEVYEALNKFGSAKSS